MPAPLHVLVVNAGSSSLKLALIDPQAGTRLGSGLAERLGTANAAYRWEAGAQLDASPLAPSDHAAAFERLWSGLCQALGDPELAAIGHRVVHGGERFSDPVRITDTVLRDIEDCIPLAPLHNPPALTGIQLCRDRFPELPQAAIFDTAFHQTLPARAFLYAVPYEWYEEFGVRRYGFHGTSHAYVAEIAARRMGRPLGELQLITAHLGNGCSACAIAHGRSVDTTMGLTPLEGLVMGTRSGDVDPNLLPFLHERAGFSLEHTSAALNSASGLAGLSGLTNDMREILRAAGQGHHRAQHAVDVFCYRLAKALLGLSAALDRVDALIFTGGIGEHAAPIRRATCALLRPLAAQIDETLNDSHGASSHGRISPPDAFPIFVVPTNEELMIAHQTAALLQSTLADASAP